MNGLSDNLEAKYSRLRDILTDMGSVSVAFSGGTDSSLLLKVAFDELNEAVVAMIALSPLMTKAELDGAMLVADEIGVSLMQVPSDCLDDPRMISNPRDRCYLCKLHNLSLLKARGRAMGFTVLVDGTNADDLRTTRPGLRSLAETETRSPLAEAGLTKQDVRELAHHLGLSNWNKPSNPCLATRIPYGEPITVEKLEKVEKAEEAVRSMGFGQVRVRMHGDLARIELEKADLPAASALMEEITKAVKGAGFRHVTLDMEGYRSGSMDE